MKTDIFLRNFSQKILFYFTNYPKMEKLKNSMETLNNEEEQVIFITVNAQKNCYFSCNYIKITEMCNK
jgi:hypothetical protein